MKTKNLILIISGCFFLVHSGKGMFEEPGKPFGKEQVDLAAKQRLEEQRDVTCSNLADSNNSREEALTSGEEDNITTIISYLEASSRMPAASCGSRTDGREQAILEEFLEKIPTLSPGVLTHLAGFVNTLKMHEDKMMEILAKEKENKALLEQAIETADPLTMDVKKRELEILEATITTQESEIQKNREKPNALWLEFQRITSPTPPTLLPTPLPKPLPTLLPPTGEVAPQAEQKTQEQPLPPAPRDFWQESVCEKLIHLPSEEAKKRSGSSEYSRSSTPSALFPETLIHRLSAEGTTSGEASKESTPEKSIFDNSLSLPCLSQIQQQSIEIEEQIAQHIRAIKEAELNLLHCWNADNKEDLKNTLLDKWSFYFSKLLKKRDTIRKKIDPSNPYFPSEGEQRKLQALNEQKLKIEKSIKSQENTLEQLFKELPNQSVQQAQRALDTFNKEHWFLGLGLTRQSQALWREQELLGERYNKTVQYKNREEAISSLKNRLKDLENQINQLNLPPQQRFTEAEIAYQKRDHASALDNYFEFMKTYVRQEEKSLSDRDLFIFNFHHKKQAEIEELETKINASIKATIKLAQKLAQTRLALFAPRDQEAEQKRLASLSQNERNKEVLEPTRTYKDYYLEGSNLRDFGWKNLKEAAVKRADEFHGPIGWHTSSTPSTAYSYSPSYYNNGGMGQNPESKARQDNFNNLMYGIESSRAWHKITHGW